MEQEKKQFVKLGDLVNDDFTVIRNNGYKFKMWDATNKKMLASDKWQDGYRKVFQLETDKGLLDLTENQLANCLVKTLRGNKADISDCVFGVASNEKTGMDIRYFFSLKGMAQMKQIPSQRIVETQVEETDLSSIPF